MRTSRRQFLTVMSTAAAAAAVPRPTRAHTTFNIGTAVLGAYPLSAPVLVAVEKGFFKQQGVHAEFLPFRGGPDLVKAVVGGEVLVGLSESTDIVVFREAGAPIRMVATHGEGNDFVLVGPSEGVRMDDLKGKAIGVTRPGAATWVFARMTARAQGWDADRDVKLVGLGGLDAQLAALARKEIAAFVWSDYGAVAQAQGRTKVIARMETLTPKWMSYIQYASEDQIRRHPDAIRRSQRALFQAMRWMKGHPRDTAALVADTLGWTPEQVAAVHKVSVPLFSEDGRISTEALKAMQDALLEEGAIKKRVALEDHYTAEFTPIRL
ncbi:MAG: ABC transporter substrate-binding protein [Candidatus Rokuibacteriota bacterium]